MGTLSLLGAPLGRRGSWQAAWLTASILIYSISPAQGDYSPSTQILVTSEPANPIKEGGSVTLKPNIGSQQILSCAWYRGMRENSEDLIVSHKRGDYSFIVTGEAFTGRETLASDCSLQIGYLAQKDTGVYLITMDISGRFSAMGSVTVQVIFKDSPSWSSYSDSPLHNDNTVEIVAGICGLVFATGMGILLFICIRSRCPKSNMPESVASLPSAPVRPTPCSPPPPVPPPPQGPPPAYENIFPFGPTGPWANPTAPPANIYHISVAPNIHPNGHGNP